MLREEKVKFLEDLSSEVSQSTGIVLLNFKGLKFGQLNTLRQAIKNKSGKCKVVKNRLLKIVLQKNNMLGLDSLLKEETAAALVYGDFAVIAKELKNFLKESDNLKIKGGYVDGNILTADDVVKIADLPSKEVLIGRMLASLKLPVYNVVYVFNNMLVALLNVLNAIKDKKSN